MSKDNANADHSGHCSEGLCSTPTGRLDSGSVPKNDGFSRGLGVLGKGTSRKGASGWFMLNNVKQCWGHWAMLVNVGIANIEPY